MILFKKFRWLNRYSSGENLWVNPNHIISAWFDDGYKMFVIEIMQSKTPLTVDEEDAPVEFLKLLNIQTNDQNNQC